MTVFTKTAEKYNSLKPVQTVRRARRAYVGLHGLAFERAQTRFAQAKAMTETLFADLVVKGEEIEGKVVIVAKDAQDKVEKTYAETAEKVRGAIPTVTLGGQKDVEELEAEVKTLESKLKKMAPKKVAAKKVAPKKAAPKVEGSVEDKYTSYIADVKGYDADADETVIRKIVNYCGIALASRDGKFVACSDETERNTVRDSLLVKKFGLKDDQAELDALVMSVCETMSKDRFKNRVTFYYLLAKSEKMLGKF
jgi:hypothetical protein